MDMFGILVSFVKFIDANLKEYQTKDRENFYFDIGKILKKSDKNTFIKYIILYSAWGC